jgi:hypothetical protein
VTAHTPAERSRPLKAAESWISVPNLSGAVAASQTPANDGQRTKNPLLALVL